jgi:carboxylesterase
MIIPTAEPFFFPGNSTGCLLVHGFTGAPKEMRWMGESLAGRGFTVLGARLAGHATSPEDMKRAHWQDWVTSVEDGYNFLKGFTDHVFILGLSLGGILSLYFSAHHLVAGVVTMSVPYNLPDDPRLRFVRILAPLIPWQKQGPADWHNLNAARDHICYPYFPTRAVIQLVDLIAEMRACLPRITAPALIIHSLQDKGVVPANAEKVYSALGSRQKQILWLENSGHVIPREPDREIAFKASADFIQQTLGVIKPA